MSAPEIFGMAEQQQTLEAVLDKIAAENDLTTIAVARMRVGDRIVCSATVHYSGHAQNGIGCSSAHSDHSLQDALHKAIVTASENRAPVPVTPVQLPAFEVAA